MTSLHNDILFSCLTFLCLVHPSHSLLLISLQACLPACLCHTHSPCFFLNLSFSPLPHSLFLFSFLSHVLSSSHTHLFSLFISPSLSHPFSLSLTHSLTLSLCLSVFLSLSHSLSLSLSLTHTLSLSLSLTHSFSSSFSLSPSFSLSHTHSLL